MKINRINLGELIRQIVEEKGMSKAQFAKSIGMHRQNIDKTVFDKASLDSNLLCEISESLGCNLFDYFKSNTDNVKEIKAVITLEVGLEKQDKTLKFSFGKNNVLVDGSKTVVIK